MSEYDEVNPVKKEAEAVYYAKKVGNNPHLQLKDIDMDKLPQTKTGWQALRKVDKDAADRLVYHQASIMQRDRKKYDQS